jgi:hypothetical protein
MPNLDYDEKVRCYRRLFAVFITVTFPASQSTEKWFLLANYRHDYQADTLVLSIVPSLKTF